MKLAFILRPDHPAHDLAHRLKCDHCNGLGHIVEHNTPIKGKTTVYWCKHCNQSGTSPIPLSELGL